MVCVFLSPTLSICNIMLPPQLLTWRYSVWWPLNNAVAIKSFAVFNYTCFGCLLLHCCSHSACSKFVCAPIGTEPGYKDPTTFILSFFYVSVKLKLFPKVDWPVIQCSSYIQKWCLNSGLKTSNVLQCVLADLIIALQSCNRPGDLSAVTFPIDFNLMPQRQ